MLAGSHAPAGELWHSPRADSGVDSRKRFCSSATSHAVIVWSFNVTTHTSNDHSSACLIVGSVVPAALRYWWRGRGRGHKKHNWHAVAAATTDELKAEATETATTKEEVAYGSWEGPPIQQQSSFQAPKTGGDVRILSALRCSPDGTLYWLETQERSEICRLPSPGAKVASWLSSRATGKSFDVCTTVYEYGGIPYLVGPNGDGVIFSNRKNQRLYWQKGNFSVLELTPKTSYEQDGRYRFADAVLDIKRKRLICVREDHTSREAAEVQHTICAIPLDGSGDMAVLAQGKDFYAAPRLSPDGCRLAWVCWDHPNMPWDCTELWLASVSADDDSLQGLQKVCPFAASVGTEEDAVPLQSGEGASDATSSCAVMQPAWSPNNELHFIADPTGWFNLYKFDEGSGCVTNLFPRKAELSGPFPPAGWELGAQSFQFLPDGRIVIAFEPEQDEHDQEQSEPSGSAMPQMSLVLLSLHGDDGYPQEQGKPESEGSDAAVSKVACTPRAPVVEYTDIFPAFIQELCPTPDGTTLYFIGSDPKTCPGIYSWSVPPLSAMGTGALPAVAPERLLSFLRDPVGREYLSMPRRVKFPTTSGQFAYGTYYAPVNPRFVAPKGTKPPLLVIAHGGPTSHQNLGYLPIAQFFTSHGFAVLDVDYRGSTGRGRRYREALYGNWGVADVEDVCAGAEYIIKAGLADPDKKAILGASAGGFTTLAALTFKDVFAAGCCISGISDLEACWNKTHKFESRCFEKLVGPPQDKELLRSRSPFHHVENLKHPILFVHGGEDRICPPEQAEMMFEALRSRGQTCSMKMYPREGHSCNSDTMALALVFFARVFGLRVPRDLRWKVDLEIVNFSPRGRSAEDEEREKAALRELLLQQ